MLGSFGLVTFGLKTFGLTLCARNLLVCHRLLTRKLKLSVGGQNDKRCLASLRAFQQSDLLR